MKKFLTSFIICFSLFISTAHAETAKTPQEVIEKFLLYTSKGELEKAYGLFSKASQERISLEQYTSMGKQIQTPFARFMLESMTYEIININEKGDTADVAVIQHLPSTQQIKKALRQAGVANQIKNETDLVNAIKEHYKNDIPMTQRNNVYVVIKEGNDWKLNHGGNSIQ